MFNKFSESSSSVQSSRPDLISQFVFDDNSQHLNTVFISPLLKMNDQLVIDLRNVRAQ